LPIVLFSSTHQRAVLDVVKDKPNIITSFAKPIISGYVEREGSVQALTEAVKRGLDLHEMRVAWKAIIESTNWGRPPSFEVAVANEFVVFNDTASGTLPWRRKGGLSLMRRRHATAVIPQLTGEHLIRRLAEYYRRYLMRGLFFDFISVPFEFLEGVVSGPAVQAVPSIRKSSSLSFSAELDLPNNCVCEALQNIRNRKDHGQVACEELPYWDYYEPYCGKIVVTLFLMWLDFIFRTGDSGNLHNWVVLNQKLENLLRKRYPTLPRIFTPKTLAGESVRWEDFAVYAMVSACKTGSEEAYRTGVAGQVISRRVEIALQKLVKLISA
jgi:hypothetical protein